MSLETKFLFVIQLTDSPSEALDNGSNSCDQIFSNQPIKKSFQNKDVEQFVFFWTLGVDFLVTLGES